jgi:hypothetical protein
MSEGTESSQILKEAANFGAVETLGKYLEKERTCLYPPVNQEVGRNIAKRLGKRTFGYTLYNFQ